MIGRHSELWLASGDGDNIVALWLVNGDDGLYLTGGDGDTRMDLNWPTEIMNYNLLVEIVIIGWIVVGW